MHWRLTQLHSATLFFLLTLRRGILRLCRGEGGDTAIAVLYQAEYDIKKPPPLLPQKKNRNYFKHE